MSDKYYTVHSFISQEKLEKSFAQQTVTGSCSRGTP